MCIAFVILLITGDRPTGLCCELLRLKMVCLMYRCTCKVVVGSEFCLDEPKVALDRLVR